MDHFAGLDVSVKETSVCTLAPADEQPRIGYSGHLFLPAPRHRSTAN